MIQMEQILKSYKIGKEEVSVLKKINVQIHEGEFVAIMGPSGSGKTTLMNLIGCLDRPTSGQYWLKNEQVSEYNDVKLAHLRNRSIGFVFQQFQLLPRLNALKNVELPMIYAGIPRKERIMRAKDALSKMELGDRMEHLPNELSGGQKQRVAIARAIVNRPDIILADEPTGALDTKTGAVIMGLFNKLNKEEGTTIIIVTHEHEISEYAERVIHVRDGEITDGDSSVGSNSNSFERSSEEAVSN